MSIDDLTSMDLTPLLLIFGIAAVIFLIYYYYSYNGAKSEYENIEEKTEYGLKVISKELGDMINIGGTVGAPIKGYRCTLVFQKEDGSRLVLKTSKAEIYEKIIVGDIGNVKFKNNILTDFIHTANWIEDVEYERITF